MATAGTCSSCGHTLHSSSQDPTEAQYRIQDLETQVRLLNSKAATAIDKLADYEDEIRNLRTQCSKLQKERDSSISAAQSSAASPTNGLPPAPLDKNDVNRDIPNRQSVSRLASLTSILTSRKHGTPAVPHLNVGIANAAAAQSTPNLSTPIQEYMKAPSPPPFATDPGRKAQSLTLMGLQATLDAEREMRLKAESSLQNAQSELEELTAQLFGQANEMVATERKARAKLEERVKLLETRDGEKRRRLERLEKAVERIERVKRLVVEHELEMEKENVGGPVGGGVLLGNGTEKMVLAAAG